MEITGAKSATITLSSFAVATCLGLAFIRPDWQEVNWVDLAMVLLWSCAAGQAMFASIWAAAGPGNYSTRAAASLAWIYGLYFALTQNPGMRDWRQSSLEHALFLFGLWLLTQMTLKALCWIVGWKISRPTDSVEPHQHAARQFTIGQLALLCASVGLFLGGVRYCLVNGAGWLWNRIWSDFGFRYQMPLLAWAALVAIVFYPALYFSCLSTRHTGRRVAVVLVLLAMAGAVESVMATDFDYDKLHTMIEYFLWLFLTPAIATGWFLIFCLFLRTAGYRLAADGSTSP